MSIFDYKYRKKTDEIPEELEEGGTVGETETFFTRHVKLIAFLICLTVFLTVFGPISIFRIVNYIQENFPAGETMEAEDVLELARRHNYLSLSDFKKYSKETESDTLYVIEVEPNVLVTVGASASDVPLEYFSVTNTETGVTVNVLASDYNEAALRALLGL